MSRRLAVTSACLALTAPLLLLGSPASSAPRDKLAVPYDFDGNGYPDLVVGARDLRVDAVPSAGGISVHPSSKRGVSTRGTVLTQASANVAGNPRARQRFGTAFASADFDHDGFADLAVGDDSRGQGSAGSVTVLFGSASGLSGSRSYVVSRAGGAPVTGDAFGEAVATADFDGDGFADLAVGAGSADPRDGGQFFASGSVTVFRGGSARFTTGRSTVLRGLEDGPDTWYDLYFGGALATGDVDGDSRPDLVVGSVGWPSDDGTTHLGTTSVCTSGPDGPTACKQISIGPGTGSTALAVGNVRGDRRNEIVVGQGEASVGSGDPGSVFTLSLDGQGADLRTTETAITQATKGVPGTNAADDKFGYAVALGDLDSDGYADLVVGSPGETIDRRDDAGRVTVVHGSRRGWRTSGNTAYDQSTKNVPSKAETGDRFGSAVSLLDHDADGDLDLAVGVPEENRSGAVTLLNGSGKGFTTSAAKNVSLAPLARSERAGASFGDSLPR